MDSIPRINVHVLGDPRVTDTSTGAAFPAKAFQLITIISRSRGFSVSRREAALLLWGNQAEAEAFTNLRQLLVRTKRALPKGCELIKADNHAISLGPDTMSLDVCVLENLFSSSKTDELLEGFRLFNGDLLQGINDATDEFLHWLTIERSKLRERLFAAAASLLIELTRYGRADEGSLQLICERLLAIDPEREESYRALIEAYGRNGNFREAERLYAHLVRMLEVELGEKPALETTAVVRRIFASARERTVDPQAFLENHPRPRVAFLAPVWLHNDITSPLLKALIEDVANELTRYRSFIVLAAHSSFDCEHNSGLLMSNASLRADYTVSGFVRPDTSGNLLVLRMTKSETGEVKWAGEFGFNDRNICELFRRTSTRVASSLAIELTRDISSNLGSRGSAKAYRHYLEGQMSLKKCTLPHVRKARAAFRNAISSCNNLAIAHAGLAQTLYLEWILLGGNDPNLLRASRDEADTSISLDPHSAHGHWMKGAAALYQQDFETSARKYAEAETLSPNSADLLLQHADALAYFGDVHSAWDRFEKAIDLNPSPPDHYWWAGASIAFTRKDFSKTIDLCERLSDDEPVLRLLAASHAWAGYTDKALEFGRKLTEQYPESNAAEMIKLIPYRDASNKQMFLEGLKKAGVN